MKFSANRASSPWYILNTREKRHLMAGKTRKEGVSKRKHGWTNSEKIKTDCNFAFSKTILRKHPFLLALRRWGRFATKSEEKRMFSQAI